MKSLVNEAPANYIRNIRLQKAKELLETSDLTISEVAYKSGFQTINHFTKVFKEEYGIPPSVYRSHNNHATNG
jgi:transcriptional regulator GlxA family with amidase domain